jgi:hypothetical protein
MLSVTSLLRTYFDKCPRELEPFSKKLVGAPLNLDKVVVRL